MVNSVKTIRHPDSLVTAKITWKVSTVAKTMPFVHSKVTSRISGIGPMFPPILHLIRSEQNVKYMQ